jgi:hypothetical protein
VRASLSRAGFPAAAWARRDAFDAAGLVDHRFPTAEQALDDAEHPDERGGAEHDAEQSEK